jgi:hypothetical protein
MAVSGSRTGPVTDEPSSGEPGALGAPVWVESEGTLDGVGTVVVVRGGRMMKHAGPAFRWLAWAAVGLRVVFA